MHKVFIKTWEEQMNYRETMEYMEEMSALGSVPGLESITELCRRLGNPQDSLFFVHIAGTNGKGSLLAYLYGMLKAAGYRTGCFSSPAVYAYREKIQVNGKEILAKEFAEWMSLVREEADAMAEEGRPHPTVFEMETAVSFLYFKEKHCDIVLLECGMGGDLDATNIVRNTLAAVFASISMDHMAYLGNTLSEIAGHKAGIIKPGAETASGIQEPEVFQILKAGVGEQTLRTVERERITHIRYGLEKQRFDYLSSSGKLYRRLEIPLAGIVQPENAALAVETAEALGRKGFSVTEKQLRQGLSGTRWPYRFEIVAKKPYFILDGAHNEDAAVRLAEGIRFYFTNRKIVYVMGMLKDKEYEKVIAQTYAYAEQIITVTPPGEERALPGHELAVAASSYHPHVTEAASLEEAVEMAYLFAQKDWVILAFGSLSYLGALGRIVRDRSERHDRSGKNKTGRQAVTSGNR